MNLLDRIELFLGEEVTTGGSGSTPGTTTDKIAKYPEKGLQKKKKKRKNCDLENT